MQAVKKMIFTLLIFLLMLNLSFGQSGNKIPTLTQLQSWLNMSFSQFDAEVRQYGFSYVPNDEEKKSKKTDLSKPRFYYKRAVSNENDDKITFNMGMENADKIDMTLYQDAITSYQSSLVSNKYVSKNCNQKERVYIESVCKAYENELYRLILQEPKGYQDQRAKEGNYNCHTTIFRKPPENNAYEITVNMGNVAGSNAILGYYFMGKTYAKDTAVVEDGNVVFKGSEKLEPGIYFIMPGQNNSYVTFLIDDNNQKFRLGLSMKNGSKDFMITSVTGSKENKLFTDLNNFIYDKRTAYNQLNSSDTTGQNKITQQVRNYQQQLITNEPNSFTAVLTKTDLEINIPASLNNISDKEKRDMQRYLYYKQHFFDNVNLSDSRLIRTSTYTSKIDYYITSLTVQHPDSVIASIDYLVKLASKNKETYKNCVIYLLNKYANANVVCFDKCYVHIIDKYYNNKNAPFGGPFWTEEEELNKIIAAGAKLRPVLCGAAVPDTLFSSVEDENYKFSLSSIKAKYTILFFWKSDLCTSCEKAISKLKEVYSDFRSKEIEVVGVLRASMNSDSYKKLLKEYYKDQKIPWLTASDPYVGGIIEKFRIIGFPGFYLLDENKRIVMKYVTIEDIIQYLKNK
jgi:peroxiredoxin